MQLIDNKYIAQALCVTPRVVNERIVVHPDFPRPALAINHKMRRWNLADFEAWLSKQSKRMTR